MKKYLWGLLILILLGLITAGLFFGCSHLENKKKLTKAEKECIKFQVEKFCIPKKRKCNSKNEERATCAEMFEKCQTKHTNKCKDTLK